MELFCNSLFIHLLYKVENLGKTRLLHGYDVGNDENEDERGHFDDELEEAFEDFEKQEIEENLDIHKLDASKYLTDYTCKWRQGPAPAGQTMSRELKLTRLAGKNYGEKYR